MRKLFASPFVAAILGGGVTAGALLGAGVVDSGDTQTVYQQSPLAATQPASERSDATGMTARDIYKRDAPGVVFVRARALQPSESPFDFFGGESPDSQATGSGFVIDDDGHILTNAHVVDNATNVTVTFSDDRTRTAKIVGKDESTDLALLKIDPDGLDLQPLALGDSEAVQVGDPTVAIGNPFGFDRTLTTGVVSALQRRITAPDGYTIENVIQTDAAINPGNSGGPLIDASGRVIGINSQIATGGTSSGNVGIGFAVPVNTAKEIVEELKADGHVDRPWLGLEFVEIDESLSQLNLGAKSGLLVQRVIPGGPADKVGVEGATDVVQLNGTEIGLGGDVITKLADREMKTSDDVRDVMNEREPGDKIAAELLSDGKRRTVTITLGDRPAGNPNE